VIFEEFKGTGNSEIVLDRELADKRIFPALNVDKSSTRREELIFPADELEKCLQLRRALNSLQPTDAIELLNKQLNDTKTNRELLARLR
jgi:transcription termination factor Rho